MTEQQTFWRQRIFKWLAVVPVALGLVAFVGQGQICLAANDFKAGWTAYKGGDYTTALRIFTRLAKQGHASAQFNLGVMYQRGYGVPRNYLKAVKWYRMAAKQGDAHGQHNLGLMYDHGFGVARDHAQALKWYRKAAEQGDVIAQKKMGIMYFLGRGVRKNYVLAYMWWSLAASRGDSNAKKFQDHVEKKMTPAQVAEAQRLAAVWQPKKSR